MGPYKKYVQWIAALCIFLCSEYLIAQDYLWPTNASRNLTSSFAEFRSGHFHAGIDIKTWGQVGYNVFATRDGYIWKVRISPYGYGKVLYQVLDTGEIAVYGHLQKFSPELDTIMYQEQKKRQRYSVSNVFNPNDYPVKKGELIAYTGRTGIGHPHLHFELRLDENTPINPLTKHFKIRDTITPIPTQLAVVPLYLGSHVDGWPIPQIYKIHRISNNEYYLKKPVQIWGIFGLALDAYDQANGATNKFSIDKIEFYLDNMKIFHSHYQSFHYDKTDQIYLDRNFWLISNTGSRFFNLYVEHGNTLDFYMPFLQENGIIYTLGYAKKYLQHIEPFTNGLYKKYGSSDAVNMDRLYLETYNKPYTVIHSGQFNAKICIKDYAGNTTTISFILVTNERNQPDKQWIHLEDPTLTNLLYSEQFNWYQLHADRWLPVQPIAIADYLHHAQRGLETGGNQYDNLETKPIFKAVKEMNRLISDYPLYIYKNQLSENLPQIDVDTYIRDPYTTFMITSNKRIKTPLYATIKNNRIGLKYLPLISHDLKHFSASISSYELANDTTNLVLMTQSEAEEKAILSEKQFFMHRIDRSETNTIYSKDGYLTLKVPKYASNQNLYLTIQKINFNQLDFSLPNDSLAPLFQIETNDIPIFKPITLTLQLDSEIKNHKQIGIYTTNNEKKEWRFVSNIFHTNKTKLEAKIQSFGQFTLIRDSKPPYFQFLTPRNGSHLTNRNPDIQIRFEDDLSDISGEKDFRLLLDGNFCIAELDPEMHIIRFKPREPLADGLHTVTFWIKDRAGNKNEKSMSFTIKGAS